MKKVQITYSYSKLDKQHQYGIFTNFLSPTYENWVWFGIGQVINTKPKFVIYPYQIEGKTIYSPNTDMSRTSADVLGRKIAKKILAHYEKIKK
jgi:hypothetical protein